MNGSESGSRGPRALREATHARSPPQSPRKLHETSQVEVRMRAEAELDTEPLDPGFNTSLAAPITGSPSSSTRWAPVVSGVQTRGFVRSPSGAPGRISTRDLEMKSANPARGARSPCHALARRRLTPTPARATRSGARETGLPSALPARVQPEPRWRLPENPPEPPLPLVAGRFVSSNVEVTPAAVIVTV